MKNPLISVLLPTHNRPDTLRLALESVLAQTVQDFEILVVGDGCTDNTADVVKSFNDDRIRWFDLPKAPNFGYANRNIVLKEARGEFMAFQAHDDLWFSDHLEILYSPFDDPSIDLVYSMPFWVSPEGLFIPVPFNFYDPEVLQSFIDRKINLMPAGNVIHRRSCFGKVGYWNAELNGCGDWDLWARIIEHGNRKNFVYLRDATMVHFRAVWRREPILEPGSVMASYGTRKLFPYWDEKLSIEVPDGELEQVSMWRYLKAGGIPLLQSLRNDISVFQDRRNIEIDQIFQNQRDELEKTISIGENFRTTSIDSGYEIPSLSHRVCFEGFTCFSSAGRMMGKRGIISIDCGREEPCLTMDLVCLRPEDYDVFPLELQLTVNGKEKRKLVFNKPNQRHSLSMTIEQNCLIELESSSSSIPDKGGYSLRLFRFQVGRPFKWSILRFLRRFVSKNFMDR